MNLVGVPRDIYDKAVAEKDELFRQLTLLQERYDRLVMQVVQLKKKGFDIDTPRRARISPAPPEPEARVPRQIEEGLDALDVAEGIKNLTEEILRERPDLNRREAERHAREMVHNAGLLPG